MWRGLPGQAEGGWPTVGKGGGVWMRRAGRAAGGVHCNSSALVLRCFYEPNRSRASYRTLARPRPSFPCPSSSAVGFTGGSDCKESVCSTGNMGSIPGSERSPRGGNCNPLRYFCLGNRVDGQRILAGNESDTTYRPKTRRNVLLV